GISMEPKFHTGDLAVVHPQRDYRVGEITAYHNRMLHTVVLHRIVAIHGSEYTFKGDNNTWLDAERPDRSQLIGALVLRVPAGGAWLHRLLQPPLLGVLAFAMVAAGGVRRGRRKRQMSRHASPRGRPYRRRPATDHSTVLVTVAAIAAVVVTGVLTAAAWLLPARQPHPQKTQRTATMALSYTAAVRPSAAYDGTVVTAPQPLFRSVTDTVTLHVDYRGAPGRMRVDARLSTPGGWTSTINLARPFDVSGDTAGLRVPVRLAALDGRARAASKVTGLPATPITVTVVPSVTDRSGHVFAPQFTLTLTPTALTVVEPGGLTAKDSVPVTKTVMAPATVRVMGHTASVATARRVTTVASTLAVLVAIALWAAAAVHRSRGEAARIQRRWRAILLDVEPIPTPPGRPVVDVPVFSALARLAERYELLVMHWDRSGVHTYVVQDGTTVFRYRTGAPAPTSRDNEAKSGLDVVPAR
ncbi:MAG: hypothetical protein JO079_12200, partial [Frankiaceae bacterium]|nr:hypothetical protein [Frankiaceae bacterium]